MTENSNKNIGFKEKLKKTIARTEIELKEIEKVMEIIDGNPDIIDIIQTINKSVTKSLFNHNLRAEFSSRKNCLEEELRECKEALQLVEENPQLVKLIESIVGTVGLHSCLN